MIPPTRVTVLGGGSGAFAVAADLQLKGCQVRLLEAPELEANIAPAQKKGGIELVNTNVSGVASGFAHLEMVTTSPKEALRGADVVLYVVPAFAEKHFTELCAHHFARGQSVVLFCGNFGGALELAHLMRLRGGLSLPLIAETEGLIYGASKLDSTTVKVVGLKDGVACAALPARETGKVLSRLRTLFPALLPATNVLETSFRNLNPVIHPPVSVLNAGRTAEDRPQWRYYWEGVTEPVGRVTERVDRERLGTAMAFGLRLPPAREVLRSWYVREALRGTTLAELLSSNPVYEGVLAPRTLTHRFLLEDVPFGLVPVEALALSVNVATPIITALIDLSSELLNRDFRAEGRDLIRLGLIGLEAKEVKQLLDGGGCPSGS